jgi:hypothetical protein
MTPDKKNIVASLVSQMWVLLSWGMDDNDRCVILLKVHRIYPELHICGQKKLGRVPR